MSDRLKLAFAEASKLDQVEQDAFAEFVLAELQDEAEWRRQFEASQSALGRLAAEGRVALKSGSVKPIDELLG